jgi:hypothetical protein
VRQAVPPDQGQRQPLLFSRLHAEGRRKSPQRGSVAQSLIANLPDKTLKEHKGRGDGADAMMQEFKRQIAEAAVAKEVSGSQGAPSGMRTTYKGALIDIEWVRDGEWHWRLNNGEWSYDGFFVQADALKAAKAAVDASQPPERP